MLSIPPDECWCKWRPDCNPICQETLIMCSFCVIDVEDWRYFCKFKVSSDIRLHLACSVLHSPTINQYQCLLDIITGVCLQQQHAAGCTPPLCSNCALHITSASSQPAVLRRHVLLTRCDTWCDTPRHVVTRGMSGVITVVTRVRILSRVLPTHPSSACPHSQGVVPIKLCSGSGWTSLTHRPCIIVVHWDSNLRCNAMQCNAQASLSISIHPIFIPIVLDKPSLCHL